MHTITVVDNVKDWPLKDVELELVTAHDYLTDPKYQTPGSLRILNLCRSYTYQKMGYYVSLVAAARGHRPQPSLLCIEDLKSDSMIRMVSQELDELVQKSLKHLEGDSFILSIYFGQSLAKCHAKLASHLVRQFPAPFLRARFSRVKDKWMIVNIFPLPLSRIPEDHTDFVHEQAEKYLSSSTILRRAKQKNYRFDFAILLNPDDPTPPSNANAIQRFIRAADKQGMRTEILGPADLGRVPEFDALLIRETTFVNHHTFRFARRAAAHGLVVIDDPHSILRCSNKIFLAELLKKHQLPMPKTTILNGGIKKKEEELPPFPFVLKQPDGCFSNAVKLIDSIEQYKKFAKEYFAASDLLIAQEFLPSTFDWRIGTLDGRLLYACKYYMVKDHWQIVRKKDGRKKVEEGQSEAVPLLKIPKKVAALALQVARLVGDGLYGIDIKEVNGQYYVIEINDNPSIDAGCEDELLGDSLYDEIMHVIKQRVESVGHRVKT